MYDLIELNIEFYLKWAEEWVCCDCKPTRFAAD